MPIGHDAPGLISGWLEVSVADQLREFLEVLGSGNISTFSRSRCDAGRASAPNEGQPAAAVPYSALTFNDHRIHYDRWYVTSVENYAGLVVHGPLRAALLANYGTELHGVPPKRFSFRGLSPLFDEEAFVLHATTEGDELKLWIAKESGPVCMTAEATWT